MCIYALFSDFTCSFESGSCKINTDSCGQSGWQIQNGNYADHTTGSPSGWNTLTITQIHSWKKINPTQ